MSLLSTRTMQIRPLRKRTTANEAAHLRTMANKVTKHKHNDKWQKTVISTRKMQMRFLSTRTMLMRLLSKRTMGNEVAKHMHNGK